MRAQERRKIQRKNNGETGSVFVEIEHSFGAVKKSAYKIDEYHEFGLSFFVPHSDGYFMANTPIKFSLINNGQFTTNQIGVVQYYHPYYDERGDDFYKIGVETKSSYRDLSGGKLTLRPPRYTYKHKNKPIIQFQLHDSGYEFELIDVSKYSAAFYCEENDLIHFTISKVLNSVQIILGQNTIFDGTATITRVYQDKNEKNRIVIEPRSKLINVDLFEKHLTVNSILEETKTLFKKHNSYNDIDASFKAAVADLRFFLEDFKRYLESPKFKTGQKEHPELLKKIYKPFYLTMDERIKQIDSIVKKLKLTPDKTPLYKCYYQKNLLPFFITSPFAHRIYFKPAGYPGDFETIRMIHSNAFEGETFFGKLINKYATSIPITQAVRKRTEYFTEKIKDAAEKNKKLKVLCIASGPALEFDLLLKNYPDITNNISITLLDQDIEALRFSQDKLYENRIKAESRIKINFIHQTIGSYLRQLARKKISENFDIVYASGLLDYFDCKTSKFVIKHLLSQTRSGGKVIVANISLDGHDHKTHMEFAHEWYLTYRSKEDMIKLSEALPEETKFKINEIENGICKFLEIEC